jgi:ribosomal protein L5
MGTRTAFGASSQSRALRGPPNTTIMSRESVPKWKAHKDMEIGVKGLGTEHLINA